ncbi:MAG: hypothetical protein M3Q80_00775 [bacterium]|nr:hypothetical protein [bacterium]
MKKSVVRTRAQHELLKDFLLIAFGLCIAAALSVNGMLDEFIQFLGSGVVASFVSGFFFTSVFTLAPASIAFVHLSETTTLPLMALYGALGALCGDLLLFFFIRDKFSYDLKRSLKPTLVKKIMTSFHFGFLKWLSPLLGALLIASPLPDELGLTLLGMSKVRLTVLIPIAFTMNFIGIYSLIWFAQALQ